MKEGRCLCGEVTIRAELSSEISACFCVNCARWGGGLQLGIEARDVETSGPVRVHQSSEIAERAWCGTCGSAIWFRYTGGRDAGYHEVCPGLFANAGDARLTRVVFADRAPDGFDIVPRCTRVSAESYGADHPVVEV